MEVGWWALIVSAGSLAVSAATFWRNRTPRPRWRFEWTARADDDEEVVSDSIRFVAENRGRGVARDVRLTLVDVDGKPFGWTEQRADELGFGGELSIWFSFEHGDDTASTGMRAGEVMFVNTESGGTASMRGREVRSSMTVELRWSQEPNLHTVHRKVSSYRR